ncbi:C2 domain-containing protein [Radiomyces spectabilis]|uniref:C2 domain-containing protein n=1 Tax=Radiomyces spectabilis TaxID=64574 RepID=UPI00221E6EF8|nr:C2 domain-containing protein [Radiomyces spectabilis]KAI8379779.1 C2 domain-containing protein [Radiomyces spectabilis]
MFSSHSSPEGTLSVTIIEARKLHGEDLIGKNDPYVELWLDEKYKQRTKELSNTNDPVWNQTFTFPIEGGSSVHKLYLKVLDKDPIGSDKIGEAKLDFADAFRGSPIDTWVKLPAKLGLTSHGEVHVYIQFIPN